jgi:DNA-binding PadR family transcriptional regulator
MVMSKTQEPLTESYFYILLCLYQGPSHGYGIMQKTLELSQGHVRIGSGTMYGATANLMQKGWIEECPPSGTGFERKRMYRLTEAGRQAVLQEIDRLNHLTQVAASVLGGLS